MGIEKEIEFEGTYIINGIKYDCNYDVVYELHTEDDSFTHHNQMGHLDTCERYSTEIELISIDLVYSRFEPESEDFTDIEVKSLHIDENDPNHPHIVSYIKSTLW